VTFLVLFSGALWRDRRGSAAAEMALATPLLIIVLFGTMELGKYFWEAHALRKAVQEGSRFASRQPFNMYDGSCAPSTTLVSQTREVTRTGRLSGGSPRLRNWTDGGTISVTGSCGPSGLYRGVYEELGSPPPIVTV
jgi:hypothetical protein